jgi:hypothetical protein
VHGLVYDDQFLQLSTALTPECSLYGFGENPHTKFRHDFDKLGPDNNGGKGIVFPMFARDEFPNDVSAS